MAASSSATAIRHAAAKLLRQDARTKLLIILTDGRPYDHDYGDARYAREDVREALTESKMSGITPFCITVDGESLTNATVTVRDRDTLKQERVEAGQLKDYLARQLTAS